MNARRRPSRVLAGFVRDLVPTGKREYEEVSKETVQTTVWIVALASGLLSVATLNEKLLGGLTRTAVKVEIGLLLGTVVLGVLQRLLQRILDQWLRNVLLNLHSHLIGLTLESDTPPEPDLLTTKEAIIGALRDHFGLDYSFLGGQNVGLQASQEAYRTQYKLWQEQEKQALVSLGHLLAAFNGKPPAWGEQLMTAQSPGDLERIRKTSRRLLWLAGTTFTIFMLTASCFVGAMIVLGSGLLQHFTSIAP